MARPRKKGMDYFPHDTDASSDEKIELLRALYGNDGYAFYFIMLERIYRTEEYEINVSDAEMIQLLAKKVGVSVDKFNQMLQTSLKYGAFDLESYEKRGVLTSEGIKRRSETVEQKRRTMRRSYRKQKVDNTGLVSDAETKAEMPQSKVKESKEKNIPPQTPPKKNEVVSSWVEHFSLISQPQLAELDEWAGQVGEDLAIKAIEITKAQVDAKAVSGPPFKYAIGILRNWWQKGIKSLDDLAKYETQCQKSRGDPGGYERPLEFYVPEGVEVQP